MSAEQYHRIRRILFCLMHQRPDDFPSEELNNYHSKLEHQTWVGLKAELLFYWKYHKKYKLTVAGDTGDKTDFIGFIDGKMVRIDITTNASYKNLDDYNNPIVYSDIDYMLITVDQDSGEITEKIFLNIPFSDKIENADIRPRKIDMVILHRAERDKYGCSKYNPYAELITVDTYDHSITREAIRTRYHIVDYETFNERMPDEIGHEDYEKELRIFGSKTAQYLSKVYNRNILACLQEEYRYYDFSHDGDGEWGYYFKWVHPLLEKLGYNLGDELYVDASSI